MTLTLQEARAFVAHLHFEQKRLEDADRRHVAAMADWRKNMLPTFESKVRGDQ